MPDPTLVMAAVSLGFQIFSGCIVAFERILDAMRFGHDAERYLAYLGLQEFLLFTFAKQSGIIDQRPEPNLDLDKINKFLAEVEHLLTDIDNLKKRYGFSLSSTLNSEDSTKKPPGQPMPAGNRSRNAELEFLYRANILEERQRILQNAKALQRVTIFPKKLWWSGVDKERFKEFITDLAKWIQGLNDLLDSNRQGIIQDYVAKTYEVVVANTNQLSQIVDLFNALLPTPNSQVPIALSRLKALRLAETESASPRTQELLRSIDVPNISISSDQLNIPVVKVKEIGGRSALYGTDPIVIDWKHPRPEDIGGIAKAVFDRQVRALLQFMQVPKPEEFCTLQLRGYLDDLPQKWGYVFSYPPRIDIQFNCQSLYDLLHQPSCLPSLTDRLQLAEKLATALYLFHTAGWLHKAISSHNIVFFTPKSTTSIIEAKGFKFLERPFLIGFDYSRPSENPDISDKALSNPVEDIYRHPKAQYPASLSHPFKPIYDIYSLGVVFMELAYWRRIESVLRDVKILKKNQDKLECKSTDLESIPLVLSKLSCSGNPLLNMPFRVGNSFSQVISTCISGDLEGSEEDYHKGLQEAFLQNIVTPLKQRRI